MSYLSITGVLLLLPTILALQCHQSVSNLKLSDPVTTLATDCGMNALACTKTVDMANNQYTKSCLYTNCTSPTGGTNLPAQCFNTTAQTGRETYLCCCYGNGCNAAPQHTISGAVAFSVAALAVGKLFF